MLETKTKVMIAAVAVLLAALVALMALHPAGKQAVDAASSSAQDEQQTAQEEEPAASASDGEATVGDWLAKQDWFKGLTSDGKTFAVTLANSRWRDQEMTSSLAFSADGTALVAINGRTEEHQWSLDDVEPQGGDPTHGTAVLKLDGSSYVVRIVASADRTYEVYPDATDSYVTCSLFKNPMFRVKDSEGFSLVGAGDGTGFDQVIAPDARERFTQELKDWCSEHAPSATTATWTGVYTVKRSDSKRVVSTELTCNNSSKTKAYVTVSEDGAWTISTRGTSQG